MAPGPLSTFRGRGSKLMFRQGCKVRPAITASYSNAQLRVYTKLCSLVMLRYEASRPSHAIASGFTSVTNNASIDRADLEYCHLSTAGQRPADGAITAHQPATCMRCMKLLLWHRSMLCASCSHTHPLLLIQHWVWAYGIPAHHH